MLSCIGLFGAAEPAYCIFRARQRPLRAADTTLEQIRLKAIAYSWAYEKQGHAF